MSLNKTPPPSCENRVLRKAKSRLRAPKISKISNLPKPMLKCPELILGQIGPLRSKISPCEHGRELEKLTDLQRGLDQFCCFKNTKKKMVQNHPKI